MILQGNQIMTLKMKATFIEAYIWYKLKTNPSKLSNIIENIIEIGNKKQ